MERDRVDGDGGKGATTTTTPGIESARYNYFNTNQNINLKTYNRYYVIDFDTADSNWSNQVLATNLQTSGGHGLDYKMYYSLHNETINNISRYYAKILAIRRDSIDVFGLDMLDLVANINNSIVPRLGQLITYFADQRISGNELTIYKRISLEIDTQITNGNPVFIREIGESAFAEVPTLRSFKFDKYLRHIEPNAFYNTSVKHPIAYTLPTNVNFALSRDVFNENEYLFKLIVPPNVSVITSGSFSDTILTAVDMHFVTKIETRAFYNTDLSTIHISANLKEIERDAFKLAERNVVGGTYTYDIIFDQPIYKYEDSTFVLTNLVDYDVIERNKLSNFMFDIKSKDAYVFNVKNLPANSDNAWNNFFFSYLSGIANVTVNHSNAGTILVLLPDSAHFTLDSVPEPGAPGFVYWEHEWTFENDTIPNNVQFVVGKKSYDLTFTGGGVFTPAGSTIADIIYDTNNQGWSVSYPSPSTRPIDISLATDDVKMYINQSASSIVMDILQPITYTIQLTYPTVNAVPSGSYLHINHTSGIINFTYSHYIEGVNPVYTLDSNITNIYYSDDYVILNPDANQIGKDNVWTSSLSSVTQFPSDVFKNNIIDSRINFGIDVGKIYSIALYQDLSLDTRNYNSGYIENRYLSKVTCEYTGSSWEDRIIYSTGMNVPVLTWNGNFSITASYADLTWDGNTSLTRYHQNHEGVVFDGVNDFKDLNDQSLGGPMTIALWARWDQFRGWSRLIDFGNGQGQDNILLGQYSDGSTKNFIFNIRRGQDHKRIQAGTITLGQWTHVAFTVVGSDMRLFQDGVQVGHNPDGHEPITMTRTNHYVGKSNWSADALFKGSIYSLQIWNRALNPTEIYDLHSQGFSLQTSWNDASSVTLKLNNSNVICSFLHTPHLYMYGSPNDLYDYN